jgi:parvulin-like peptidyl-prolyl isomerase
MKKNILFFWIFTLIFLAACNNNDQQIPTVAPVAEITDGQTEETAVTDTQTTPQDTAVPATPTPAEPMAAVVNGAPIFLADYELELARYEQGQAELGIETPDPNYKQIVLDALIEKALIQQAAAQQGISVTPEMVDQQLAQLRTTAGEAGNFEAWLEVNHWTEEQFREEIATGMVIEQMVALVTASVPSTAEQVRASVIQVNDPELANTLLTQIRNGDDFAFLAAQHSVDAFTAQEGGDLGFFAQGSLLVPEVETAAFALTNVGDVSEVVPVTTGDGSTTYYIVQLTERDPQRPLPTDMQVALYEEAFQRWLGELWQNATVERLVQ